MTNTLSLPAALRHLRKDVLRLTQKDFAAKIGVDRSSISNVERGEHGLAKETIEKIETLWPGSGVRKAWEDDNIPERAAASLSRALEAELDDLDPDYKHCAARIRSALAHSAKITGDPRAAASQVGLDPERFAKLFDGLELPSDKEQAHLTAAVPDQPWLARALAKETRIYRHFDGLAAALQVIGGYADQALDALEAGDLVAVKQHVREVRGAVRGAKGGARAAASRGALREQDDDLDAISELASGWPGLTREEALARMIREAKVRIALEGEG